MISERYGGRMSLSVEEAADVASLSKSTVYALIEQREFPHFRGGKAVRVWVPALVEWIESGGSQPPARERPPARRRRAGRAVGNVRTFANWSGGAQNAPA